MEDFSPFWAARVVLSNEVALLDFWHRWGVFCWRRGAVAAAVGVFAKCLASETSTRRDADCAARTAVEKLCFIVCVFLPLFFLIMKN